MSLRHELYPEPDLLRVDATGEFSLEEAKRTFLEMLGALAQYKVKKVLLDGRTVAGEPEVMERFYYGEFAASSVANFATRGVAPGTQFAYVLREPVLDPGRFGETVAVNRGMNIKVFDNMEEALAWLDAVPADKPQPGDGN